MLPPSRASSSHLALLLLGSALLLALLLVFWGVNAAPGCGQGCSSVLASKWSSVFGIPVGLLGALSYAAVLMAHLVGRKWFFEIASVLVLGAALWFGILQLFVLRAFCPWCCLTHACAVGGVFLLWLSPRSGAAGRPSWGPVAFASVVMALFITLQAATPEHANTTLASVGATSSEMDEVSGARILTVHDGAFKVDVSSLPILGSVTADELIVSLTDYTCRQLHQSLERVQDSMGSQLGVVPLPAVRGEEREMKLSIAADVKKLITVDPPLLTFDASKLENLGTQSVKITLDEPVTLGPPSTASPFVSLELKTLVEHLEYELVATPKQALNANVRLGVIIPIIPGEAASALWPSALQVPLVVRPSGTALMEHGDPSPLRIGTERLLETDEAEQRHGPLDPQRHQADALKTPMVLAIATN